jgi:chorismate--pyruvate lyase
VHDLRQGWIAHPLSIPRPWRHWLVDRGSLTERLRSHCPDFRVAPLATGLARAHSDECDPLALAPRARAYVREVLLMCGDTPAVFAHSVLPLAGLRGGWRGITGLGSRSLGEALLRDPRIVRQALSFRRVVAGHPLYDAAAARLPDAPHGLWARRSAFCLNGHPLLVTEVFLPLLARP